MSRPHRPPPRRLSGMVAPTDTLHQAVDDPDHIIAPNHVEVPGGKYVAQYAPTVRGTSVAYDPSGNCDGYFMSARFQPNNNCYNYSTNIASNSFAQPGRLHGLFLDFPPTGEQVVQGAELDGLVQVGGAGTDMGDLEASGGGHFVALLISAAYDPQRTGWNGDYHWVRCDTPNVVSDQWSQKDGSDQVTNFDFLGDPITNPATANWTVNQGPDSNGDDVIASYDFYAWMWVPDGAVHVI